MLRFSPVFSRFYTICSRMIFEIYYMYYKTSVSSVSSKRNALYIIRSLLRYIINSEGIVYHQAARTIHADAWWYTARRADDMHRTSYADDIPSHAAWIKKERSVCFVLFWWPGRESNSCYRRERAVSWPLDHRALLVAGVGFEPTTLRVWTECSSQLSYPAI